MYFNVIYHLILFHITSKYIVWYISDHIANFHFVSSIQMCYVIKKYLQYVTFYYIKKYCIKFSSAW